MEVDIDCVSCIGENKEECQEIVELLLLDDDVNDQAVDDMLVNDMMMDFDNENIETSITENPFYSSVAPRLVSDGSKSNASDPLASSSVAGGNVQPVAVDFAAPTIMQAPPALTGRPSIPLYLSCNPDNLSAYQSEIRKQIEFFEATDSYVTGQHVKGRNKAIVLGQVGIQCRHCSHIHPPQSRAKGSTYFPQKLIGIYQAAQILSTTHLLDSCPAVPAELRQAWKTLQQQSKASRTAGKDYWAGTAQALGVYEDANGLKFEPRLPSYDTLMERKRLRQNPDMKSTDVTATL